MTTRSSPRRTAIIHIGTAKTGTTTIQRMLMQNRDALLVRGFCFPHSPGERNHFRLAIYAGDTGKLDRMIRSTGEAGDRAYVAERFAADFRREMAALPDHVRTCVFSNEHCYRKISTPAAAQRLKDLLDEFFDAYRVVAYLRRQDEMAVSVYSTRLRSGDDRLAVLPDLDADPQFLERFDWFAMLDRWAAVFGQDAIVPRVFGREDFVGGDLLKDFCDVCGLGDGAGLAFPDVKNSALSAPAQEFLRRLNMVAGEDDGDDEKAPQFVRQFLDAHHSGRGRRPSRAEAEAFAARFDASNERLRAAWLPERPAPLFPADFSRYPEVPDPLPGDAEVLDVALRLIAHQAAGMPNQEADATFRRAAKRLQAGERAEGRALLNRALAKEPGHAGALRALLAASPDGEDRAEAAARLGRALRAEPGREDLLGLAEEFGVDAAAAPPERRRAKQRDAATAPAPAAPATAGREPAAAAAARPSTPEERRERRAAREAAGLGARPAGERGAEERERRKAERREERRRARGVGGGPTAGAAD